MEMLKQYVQSEMDVDEQYEDPEETDAYAAEKKWDEESNKLALIITGPGINQIRSSKRSVMHCMRRYVEILKRGGVMYSI